MKIKKGDKVKIMTGKDSGKEGPVERVWEKGNLVLVPNINIYKKHVKPRGEGQKGQIVALPRPLDVSKVALICPKCKQPTRVGYRLTAKEKVRICRKCQQEI